MLKMMSTALVGQVMILMPKLNPAYAYRQDGSKGIRAYTVNLRKTECEKYGFDENTQVDIEYFEDKIVLTKALLN